MQTAQLQAILTMAAMLLIPAGFGGGGFVLIREASIKARRRTRLAPQARSGQAAQAPPMLSGVIDGMRHVGDRIAIQDPARLTHLRARLMQAGFFSRESVTLYLGARVTAMVLATGATLFTLPWAAGHGGGFGATIVAGLFAAAAIMGPDQIIKRRIATRERQYREGFPDLLDLLVASVEAGLSLDAAVHRITGELVRRYPFLAERLGIDEAKSFATMLRQSEEMGTSLGDTLKVFSDEMRTKRMMRAEEKALALPAKLTVPLILFIFPCLLGVLILPAAVKVFKVLGKG